MSECESLQYCWNFQFLNIVINNRLMNKIIIFRCSLPSLAKRHVAIARLKHAANMGRNSHEVRFFILVVTPSKEVTNFIWITVSLMLKM